MNAFKKENFNYFGGYLEYYIDGSTRNSIFIARFKYRGGGKAAFQAFLIKNFTVEEYQELYATKLAPLEILQTKGYISPNIRKVLKYYNLKADADGLMRLDKIRREEARL